VNQDQDQDRPDQPAQAESTEPQQAEQAPVPMPETGGAAAQPGPAGQVAPAAGEHEASDEAPRSLRRIRSGVVVSVSGAKTVRVQINSLAQHPLYGKYIKQTKRLLVDDPQQQARLGDTVEVVPCRPVSKHMSWRLVRVVKHAALV
jgi:small subunit ribosomal protein S17